MPYIKQEIRDAIKSYVGCVDTYGDLNYVITLVLLQTFKAVPKYDTLHVLRRDFVTFKKDNPLLNKLRVDFADRFTVSDIYAASEEAYHEFRDRVGKLYEAGKCLENGDLPEYEELIGPLLQNIGELRQKREAEQKSKTLILPGEVK